MSIQTTAVKQGDTYVLNGQKTFITNGIHADLIIVVCKTDFHAEKPHRVISLLLVNKDTPRFSKGRKLRKVGVYSQDTAELHFEDARVPASNLLGEEGKGFGYDDQSSAGENHGAIWKNTRLRDGTGIYCIIHLCWLK